MLDFAETLADFEQQLAAFHHRCPSRAEAEREIAAHCQEVFSQLSEMLPILTDYPVYAGIAFHGRMQIVDRRRIAALSAADTPAREAIQAVREAKALRIAATARTGWELLLAEHPEALWCAIRLNALATLPKLADLPAQDEDECAEDEEAGDGEDNEDDDEN